MNTHRSFTLLEIVLAVGIIAVLGFHGINLDHTHLPDPLAERLEGLQHEIDLIEQHLKEFRKSQTPHHS